MSKAKRAISISIMTACVFATGFVYQWFADSPNWEEAVERGYFSAIMVPLMYWYYKWSGWLTN
jgi:prepilin signal peptidase PulO-like enzyme (type II secretory pathway)